MGAVASPTTCKLTDGEPGCQLLSTAGPAWVDSGLVFTTVHGTPIEPRNLNRH
jgi:hypothetical protein